MLLHQSDTLAAMRWPLRVEKYDPLSTFSHLLPDAGQRLTATRASPSTMAYETAERPGAVCI